MMRFSPFCVACALMTVNGWAQVAPVNDDAPPDAAVLDDQIATLTKLREQKKTEFFLKMRDEISRPVQNPGAAGNFVIDCMRQVQYEGRDGGNAEFAEWKKKNRDLLSNHDFERAADLHLRYLALTLKRATLKSAETVQGEVWAYLDLLNKSQDLIAGVVRNPAQVKIRVFDEKSQQVSGEIVGEMENLKLASATNVRGYVQELLNGSVSGGLAAQALKLDRLLDGIPDWEMVPGDFSGIMDQDIRTYLREKKDPKLISTWDTEIAYLAAIAALKQDENAVAKFEKETLPRLRWKQAKDVELIGMPNRALTMRIAVAKGYPQHPDFEQWTTEISGELGKRKAATAAVKKAAGASAALPGGGESAPFGLPAPVTTP